MYSNISVNMDIKSISDKLPSIQGIYKIECVENGKVYIGQSVNIRCRAHEHRRMFEKNKHNNLIMQYSYNKYGKKSFTVTIVEEVKNSEMLKDREEYWINHYQSLNSFNICPVEKTNSKNTYHGEKVRGTKNGNSKLNKSKVVEICTYLNQEQLNCNEIGKLFNVTSSAIKSIAIGRTWEWLTYKYLKPEITTNWKTQISVI